MTSDEAMPEPIFRFMRPDDLDEVFELIQVTFGESWPDLPIQVAPIDHLRWKVSSPRVRPDAPEIIEVGGRIAGYAGGAGYSRDVYVRGRRLPGWQGGDYCIHPDFQGQGLTAPWRVWRDALPSADSVAIGEGSTHPRLLRSGKRRGNRVFIANKVDNLTLYLEAPSLRRDGRVTARSVLGAARVHARKLVNRLRWRSLPAPAPQVTICTVDQFDERADELWERAQSGFDYALVRDRQRLNWRYCDPRAGIYRVRAAERDGELAGYMVTALREGDSQVVDVLTLPGDEAALRALVDDAITGVGENGARVLTVLMPRSHAYRETFSRAGFIPSKWVSNMGYGARENSPLDFLETDRHARLHVAFGDTDHV